MMLYKLIFIPLIFFYSCNKKHDFEHKKKLSISLAKQMLMVAGVPSSLHEIEPRSSRFNWQLWFRYNNQNLSFDENHIQEASNAGKNSLGPFQCEIEFKKFEIKRDKESKYILSNSYGETMTVTCFINNSIAVQVDSMCVERFEDKEFQDFHDTSAVVVKSDKKLRISIGCFKKNNSK